MNDKNQGLNERLEHRKRIQRMKTGLLWFVFTWMLALMLIEVTLIAKVFSLQEQIDIITENTIRSQQVEQKENQSFHSNSVQKYGASAKNSETGAENESAASASVKTDHGNLQKAEQTNHLQPSVADMEDKDQTEENDENEQVRKVYLTFDDGPSKNTEKILDILDEYEIKATFFVTGKLDDASLKRYEEITRRGHTIGMHSFSHKYDEIYESVEAFEQDLEKIRKLILEKTGQTCSLYRFPGGSSNQVSGLNMEKFIQVLNKKDITYFDWNAECGDASSNQYSAAEMVDNVMKDVVKYHTSVVLLHDAEDKPNTLKALPVIIRKLQAMDAQILPIDENTTVVQHVLAENVED